MASEVPLEECFAPEVTSEDEAPAAAPKRFCTNTLATSDTKVELEKIALKRYTAFKYDNDDTKDECITSTTKLEERIRYLQLDLANSKLEIIELNEKYKPIKERDEALNRYQSVLEVIANNINMYKELILTVSSTPNADLVRQETEKIKAFQWPDLEPLPTYIQAPLILYYSRYETDQTFWHDKFHENIQWKESKENIRKFLEGAFMLLLSQILGQLLYYLVFRRV